MNVKPKKHLGQHFLNDKEICQRIADSLTFYGGYKSLIEIGPGTGALTEFLTDKKVDLYLMDVDDESIQYLNEHYNDKVKSILHKDFLNFPLEEIAKGEKLGVIGNFPYNISSQILFRVLDYKDTVTEVVGMFQKEVAKRVAEKEGTKDYGIISVLLQAYYDIEYLFTVDEHVFTPPPKVKSGVIRLRRNNVTKLGCDEVLFKQIVKATFNQRRKMIRNSIKPFNPKNLDHPFFTKRPEQLSVAQFIELTNFIEENRELS